jgi:hypothetical protein
MNSQPEQCLAADSEPMRLGYEWAVLTHNVLTALKRIGLSAEYLNAQRLRFPVLPSSGPVDPPRPRHLGCG